MVTARRQWFTASWCHATPVPLAVALPGCLNRRVRDREELVRRWQAGWSVSRGWTTVEDANDGILIASIDGLRLYRSLGWKVVADIVIARSR